MTDETALPDELVGLGYGEAVQELEAILSGLESSVADVDALADQVQRAGALIRYCKDRLAAVEADVAQAVVDFQDPPLESGAEETEPT